MLGCIPVRIILCLFLFRPRAQNLCHSYIVRACMFLPIKEIAYVCILCMRGYVYFMSFVCFCGDMIASVCTYLRAACVHVMLLKYLLILDHLLPRTRPTLVLLLDDSSRTLALWATRLHLLNHTRRELPQNNLDTLSRARVARGFRVWIFATGALAAFAYHVSCQRKLDSLAVVPEQE